MFLVLFVILPQVCILSFFFPMFLSCLRLTSTFVFNFWCRVRMVFDPTWIFQLYGGDQFYWWRKSEHSENTTNLSLVADKLYHIMFHRIHLTMGRIRHHNLVIYIGYVCSFKSNNCWIMITTSPLHIQYNKYSVASWEQWVSDCWLAPNTAISCREQANLHWNDNQVRFVLVQHA
jgi:hypothetical protein